MISSCAVDEASAAPYEDEFYESFDRILSSSCSSTSVSDDDADHYHRYRFPPPAAAAYEVWITEPGSVDERRQQLLQIMGLDNDPSLSRAKPPVSNFGAEGKNGRRNGEVEKESGPALHKAVYRRVDSFSSTALFVRSRSDYTVDSVAVHGRKFRLAPSVRSPSVQLAASKGGYLLENNDDDARCTIRNLDNGREFVLKEFRDDGMWNKLREVGTGRQLTMEEFEMCVGRSPIVHELMRRQNIDLGAATDSYSGGVQCNGTRIGVRVKRRGNLLKSIKNIAGNVLRHHENKNNEERDSSSEKGGRSSSATDDSQEGSNHQFRGADKIRVRQYGKSFKELTGLYLTQEIQAHTGSIWSIVFSIDGRYLASAGEDCVIHIWQVLECEQKGGTAIDVVAGDNGNCNQFMLAMNNGNPDVAFASACMDSNNKEKKRRPKLSSGKKSLYLEKVIVPEHIFALEEKPFCSFRGHLDDVLDLSWSKSEYLLSSSMDKTVRLWHISSISCLKIFSHSDYVTSIQFNPIDDRYFISGSLDDKIRIWSISDQRVVDWSDLHEMVTAACYTPDGQGALVGSHKGSCHLYVISDNKLHKKTTIELQNKKNKSSHKKITGFQFAQGSNSKVLITSADSRIRIVDGVELVHKLKGFRNRSSQMSASLTINGKHVICASEDSHVYIWRHDTDSDLSRSKGNVNVIHTYEHFHCHNVTAAIPWTSSTKDIRCCLRPNSKPSRQHLAEAKCQESVDIQRQQASCNINHTGDRASSTWPEEKLPVSSNPSVREISNDCQQNMSAWGMVIVTAARGGQIRTFQNFGFPVKV